MRKRAVVISSLLGVGAIATVWPDLRAYRRLAAITHSIRAAPSTHGEPISTPSATPG